MYLCIHYLSWQERGNIVAIKIIKMEKILYHRFLNKYFNLIKGYISYGVTDRQYSLYNAGYWNPPYMGCKTKKFNLYDYNPDEVSSGNIYRYNGKLYICYPVKTDNNKSEKIHSDNQSKIIPWGSKSPDGKITYWGIPQVGRNPLYHLIELNEIKPQNSQTGVISTYEYSYLGETRRITYREYYKYEEGRKLKIQAHFRFDAFIESNNVTDPDVTNAIRTFFDIISYVSGLDDSSKGANKDITETVKIILGLPASPLRYLPSLGHQLLRYIVNSFSQSDSLNLSKYEGKGEYDALLSALTDHVFKKIYKDQYIYEDTTRKKANEAISLIRYDKRLRNIESHQQQEVKDPATQCQFYLADHILLVYILQSVLKWEIKDKLKKDIEENPNNYQHRSKLSQEDEAELAKAITPINYDEIIPLIFDKLKDVDARLVKLEDIQNMPLDKLIETINRSLDNYAAENGQRITSLSHQINEIKVIVAADNELIKDLKDTYFNIKVGVTQIGKDVTWIDKKVSNILKFLLTIKKGLKYFAIISIILVGIVASFLIFGTSDWGYWFASRDGVARLGQVDTPYERALKIESQLSKYITNNLEAYDEHKCNMLRKKAASCYQKAIKRYEKLVAEDSVENAEKAYRLALMYLRGKGGHFDHTKALYNAEIAAKHLPDHQGLECYITLIHFNENINSNFKIRLKEVEENAENDPFTRLSVAIQQLLDISDREDSTPEEAVAVINELSEIANTESDAQQEAYRSLFKCYAYGIQNAKSQFIFDKSILAGLRTLTLLAEGFNDLTSQTRLGYMYAQWNSPACISAYIDAYSNGATEYASYAYLAVDQFIENADEFIKNNYPEINDDRKLPSYVKAFITINKLAKEKDYTTALKKYNDLLSKLPGEVSIFDSRIDMLRLMVPDSAKAMHSKLLDIIKAKQPKFTHNVDSTTIETAITNYLDAFYHAYGYGNYEHNQHLADSLLIESYRLGLTDAAYTLGRRFEAKGFTKATLDIMTEISDYSDAACEWLAEHYRLYNPDKSIYYAKAITDSLNLYKLLRIFQCNWMDQKIFDTPESRHTATVLYKKLNNAFDWDKPYSQEIMASYFTNLAGFDMVDDWGRLEWLSNASHLSSQCYGIDVAMATLLESKDNEVRSHATRILNQIIEKITNAPEYTYSPWFKNRALTILGIVDKTALAKLYNLNYFTPVEYEIYSSNTVRELTLSAAFADHRNLSMNTKRCIFDLIGFSGFDTPTNDNSVAMATINDIAETFSASTTLIPSYATRENWFSLEHDFHDSYLSDFKNSDYVCIGYNPVTKYAIFCNRTDGTYTTSKINPCPDKNLIINMLVEHYIRFISDGNMSLLSIDNDKQGQDLLIKIYKQLQSITF